jgi:hypothetical protein
MGWGIVDFIEGENDRHAAGPIGEDALDKEVTLTRIQEKDGQICYGEEVPATQTRDDPHEFQFMLNDQNGRRRKTIRWNRLAIKVKSESDLTSAKENLTLAEFPYSSLVGFWVPFKNRNRGGVSSIYKRMEGLFFNDSFQFIDWMEALPFDYGVTTNKVYTASVFLPNVASVHRQAKSPGNKAISLYGICSDPESIYQALWSSQTVQDLLKYTSDGTLGFTKDRDRKVPIKQKVKELAPELMACSIRQAMAGLRKEQIDLKGKPLEFNISYIYRDLINCLNRSKKGQDVDVLDRYSGSLHANSKKQFHGSNKYDWYAEIALELIPLRSSKNLPSEGVLLVAIKETNTEILVRIFDCEGNTWFDQTLISKDTTRKKARNLLKLLAHFLEQDPPIEQEDQVLLLESIYHFLAESPS